MGDILHHQLVVQNVLQAQFCLVVKDNPQDAGSLQPKGRHAAASIVSQIAASHFQVLRGSAVLPGRKLHRGEHARFGAWVNANERQAEKYLVEAWDLCQKDARPNSE